MKKGDKVMIRDGWIKSDNHVPQCEVVDVAYFENSTIEKVYLVELLDGTYEWIEPMGLKTE